VEMPSMTRRDLIRLLLLAKFGGVFVDVDTVFLRDLSEVVRAGPGVIVEKVSGHFSLERCALADRSLVMLRLRSSSSKPFHSLSSLAFAC